MYVILEARIEDWSTRGHAKLPKVINRLKRRQPVKTSFPSESEMPDEIPLRYGSNPHQTPARAYVRAGNLPFRILSGNVGYINLLDALNSWQLVRELRQATGL